MEPNSLMSGKRGLVLGVANDKSIAWGIAQKLRTNGAELILTYQNEVLEKRVRPLAQQLECEDLIVCDVRHDQDVDHLFAKIEQKFGGIDFLVHSLAYADKDVLHQRFYQTGRQQFTESLDISAYSLISLAKGAMQLSKKPSSILALSYLGGQKVVPGYNLMGVAKAALEMSVRYLAYDLGEFNTRVNAISAGPIRTLASSAVPNIKKMIQESGAASPLRRPITQEDVAKSALYFLSDLSSGVSGEIHFVDGGYNTLAVGISNFDSPKIDEAKNS